MYRGSHNTPSDILIERRGGSLKTPAADLKLKRNESGSLVVKCKECSKYMTLNASQLCMSCRLIQCVDGCGTQVDKFKNGSLRCRNCRIKNRNKDKELGVDREWTI